MFKPFLWPVHRLSLPLSWMYLKKNWSLYLLGFPYLYKGVMGSLLLRLEEFSAYRMLRALCRISTNCFFATITYLPSY